MTDIPDDIMAKARLEALAVGRYPLLETEKFHIEVSLARGALRSGFKEGYAAALSERTASEAGVVVKALEWRDHRGQTFPDTWTAQTPCGVYEIEERSASDSPAYVATGPLHVFLADKDSLEDAKAAAQADFDKRIRSALSQPVAMAWPRGTRVRVEHDGFEGVVLGPYTTLEGKRGQVCQLAGARVVHVYGEKWLMHTNDTLAETHPTDHDGTLKKGE